MTRIMGDATHLGVPQLAAVPGLQLVAGYVTGTPDIRWTASDWAVFPPGIPQVVIDQGGVGSPVDWAHVRDVEPLAWSPAAAVNLAGWTASRPTIYCDRNDLSRAGGVLASGWVGDLWLAIPDWQPGDALPYVTPGCTIVAVQNQLDVNNAYDLSVVLDPAWPARGNPMPAFMVAGATDGSIYLVDGGKVHHVTSPAAVANYQSIGIQLITQDATEVAALLADFPAGNPAVTVTIPPLNISTTGTVTHG